MGECSRDAYMSCNGVIMFGSYGLEVCRQLHPRHLQGFGFRGLGFRGLGFRV